MRKKPPVRTIALYLPQYHPIPENDHWWGKGFTEWTNVSKAKPLFKGHYQPHLPTELGFYDLRVPEVREAQAKLAAEHGIYGFCYYHYWFNGQRILERPFEEVFRSGKPNFPFMLCWANENWTRTWDGQNKDILLEQRYSPADDLDHIRSLIPYFKDPRYIRINDRPVVAIYASQLLPDARQTLEIWRTEAARQGLKLYLCRIESHHTGGKEYLNAGFDAAIDFQPWGDSMRAFYGQRTDERRGSISYRIKRQLIRKLLYVFNRPEATQLLKKLDDAVTADYIFDYPAYVDFARKQEPVDYKRYPMLMPMWDNSPRRAVAPAIFVHANPDIYQAWLQHIVQQFEPFGKEENLVFINAWNEWGEGNHLEPCSRWGRQYLEATKAVLEHESDIR